MEGIKDLPEFLGVICQTCNRPFLIWKTEFEGIWPDDPDIDKYKEAGNKVKEIDRSVVGDIKQWCGCNAGEMP